MKDDGAKASRAARRGAREAFGCLLAHHLLGAGALRDLM